MNSVPPPDPFKDLNFRDLGGLPVVGGRKLRSGVLFRAAGPGSFTPDHLRAMEPLGVRFVCDLRSEHERSRSAHDWGAAAHVLNLNLPDDFGGAAAIGSAMIRSDPTARGAHLAMRASYAAMPAAIRPHLPAVLDAIAAGSLPLLMHCTAGKDRTGVLTALLLALLGVPREAVIADYLRSGAYGDRLRIRGGIVEAFSQMYGVPLDAPTVDAIIGVDREYILSAYRQVETDWGSLDAYFSGLGVDRATIDRVRLLLIDS